MEVDGKVAAMGFTGLMLLLLRKIFYGQSAGEKKKKKLLAGLKISDH